MNFELILIHRQLRDFFTPAKCIVATLAMTCQLSLTVFADTTSCVNNYPSNYFSTDETVLFEDSLLLDPSLDLLKCLLDHHEERVALFLTQFYSKSNSIPVEKRMQLTLSLAELLFGADLKDEALACVDTGFSIATLIPNSNWKSRVFSVMASAVYNENKRYAAMPYMDSALANIRVEEPAYKAYVLMNFGRAYYDIGDYASAMPYYDKARTLFEANNIVTSDYADLMHYIGSVFKRQYEDSTAAVYYQKMIDIGEEIGKPLLKAEGLYLLADIYGYAGDLDRELRCLNDALDIYENLGNERGIVQALLAIAHSYIYALEDDKAIKYCNLALERNRGNSKTISFNAYRYLGRLYARKGEFKKAQDYFSKALEVAQSTDEKRLINLRNLYYTIAFAQVKEKDWESAFYSLEKYIHYQDTLVMKENRNIVFELEQRYENEKKEAEILMLNKDKEIARSRLERQKIALLAALMGIFLVVALAYSIYSGKKKSDELLLNILPEETAQELKEKGHSDAQLIDHVTVLFTDFKGFTALSEQVTPKELVNDLHSCFSAFDKICEKYGIEKIKTIGDAYMAAGGLPSPNATHAQDVVRAALEMAQIVEQGKAKKTAEGLPYFEIRIGVHTGPVVAGIVGVKKFQYDIWGDTVNTASRMESSGEVGKVNISEATYELLKDDPQFSFESRGKIEAKGKGEMEMYFVEKFT